MNLIARTPFSSRLGQFGGRRGCNKTGYDTYCSKTVLKADCGSTRLADLAHLHAQRSGLAVE